MIGINAQIRSDSGNADGVGFAIPINSARRSMEQLIATGRVACAYVGVTTQDVTPAIAKRFDLGAERGALIQSVVEDAPADRAGLRGGTDEKVFNGIALNLGGDLIVSFGGTRVERGPTSPDRRRAASPGRRPGDRHPERDRQAGDGPRPPDRAAARPDALTDRRFSRDPVRGKTRRAKSGAQVFESSR